MKLFTLFILISFSLLSFVSIKEKEKISSVEQVLDSLYTTSEYVLKIQVLKRDNDEQWSRGYTDYHVECLVQKDYKNNYDQKKVYFHHRVSGLDKNDILHKQLSIGQEYVVFLDSAHTTISEGIFKNGSLEMIEHKVYILIDNNKGVVPYTPKVEKTLK